MRSYRFIVITALTLTGAAAQSQPAATAQQTNGQGAIGVFCNAVGSKCKVAGITRTGPAERAGVRLGDLLFLQGTAGTLVEEVHKHRPGDQLSVLVQRGTQTIPMTIAVEDQLAL